MEDEDLKEQGLHPRSLRYDERLLIKETEQVKVEDEAPQLKAARDWISALPILEPLSKATETTMAKLRVYDTDFLEIDMDDEGRRFVIKPIFGRINRLCTCKCRIEKNPDRSPSYDATHMFWKKIPECHKHKAHPDRWVVAGTDFTCLVIHHTWKYDQLIFKSDHAKNLYEFLITRFLAQTKTSLIGAAFKVSGTIPPMPKEFTPHPELPISDYQKVPVAMSVGAEAFALFMEQGTGKTPTTIARICIEARRTRLGLYGKPRMMRVLVICPRPARLNWQKEIERFTTVQGKTIVLRGDKFRRIRGVVDAIREEDDCEFGACIATYEKVVGTWEAISMVPWDLVIMDESHYIKSQGAERSKVTRLLRDTSARRMILTGTPITNSVMDLWSQFEFLGDGMSGFLVNKNFKTFYGKYEKIEGSPGIEKLVALKNLPLIQERLARISFSITKKEANLGLPDKTYDIYEVDMTSKQKEFYQKMQQQLALEIEADKRRLGKKMTANHILVKMLRLAQITSGHVKWDATYDEEGEELTAGKVEQINPGKNPKVDGIIEMYNDMKANDPKCKMIVWATFIEDIKVLSARCDKEGIKYCQFYGGTSDKERIESERRFNDDPECGMMIANPKAASVALNFVGYDWWNGDKAVRDTYCGREIYMSMNWSPTERSQSEDRAHRRGTRCNVRITDLQVSGTIDEEIRNRVLAKQIRAGEIQDISSLLNRLLESKLEDDDE